MIIPILLHSFFLLIYALLIAALLWHYKRYSLPHDPGRWVIGPFLVFSVIIAVIATILLFYTPWNAISIEFLAKLQTPQANTY